MPRIGIDFEEIFTRVVRKMDLNDSDLEFIVRNKDAVDDCPHFLHTSVTQQVKENIQNLLDDFHYDYKSSLAVANYNLAYDECLKALHTDVNWMLDVWTRTLRDEIYWKCYYKRDFSRRMIESCIRWRAPDIPECYTTNWDKSKYRRYNHKLHRIR